MVTSNIRERSRRIVIFTATRAEYGIFRPLIVALKAAGADVRLLVSGTHLSRTGGETWREIVADGHTIDAEAEILLDSDTSTAICTAMGLGLIRYGDTLARLKPDLMVLLGDRFETLAAAVAAFVSGIPIAHLHGGEQTLGALDEGFRHATTKLSQMHFTSTAAYRDRVIQLGEQPERVFDVGALGVENVLTLPQLDRRIVEERLGLRVDEPFLLLTFHPATLDRIAPEQQLDELIAALDQWPQLRKVFTGANADLGGSVVNARLAALAQSRSSEYCFFPSLGARLYTSAARHAQAVVGNSSSGIIEVPSLGVPTLDIGERQRGRVRAASVAWCAPERKAIAAALTNVLSDASRAASRTVSNPYYEPNTALIIAERLVKVPLDNLRVKTFHDLPFAGSGRINIAEAVPRTTKNPATSEDWASKA